MDVGTVQNPAVNVTMPGQKAGTPQDAPEVKMHTPEVKIVTPLEKVQPQEAINKVSSEKEPEKEKVKVENTVESLNKFMDLMSADIRFKIHQKTNRMMVQLISEKDQTVLREYPSKEFLDMIANIREFVGILTDKKA